MRESKYRVLQRFVPPLAVGRTSVGIALGLDLLLMLFAPLPAGVGEIGEIKSVKKPKPAPEEFIKSLTYWESVK